MMATSECSADDEVIGSRADGVAGDACRFRCNVCGERHDEGKCNLRFPRVVHSRYTHACWSCLLPLDAHPDDGPAAFGRHCQLKAGRMIVEVCMYVWKDKDMMDYLAGEVEGLASERHIDDRARYAKWLGELNEKAPFTNGALVVLALWETVLRKERQVARMSLWAPERPGQEE